MKFYFQKKSALPLLSFTICMFCVQMIVAQTREAGPWWPNKLWGPEDQSGGSNWITQQKVIRAVSLVKTGKIIELGHPYERGMPMPGVRSFNLFIPSFPTYAPSGSDHVVFNDEYVTSEIGQVGTQFDGPGHVGKQMKMADSSTANIFYNGVNGEEMKNPYGLQKLGVEHIKPIITRGILIDLAAYKNIQMVSENYEITIEDVLGALAKEGLTEKDIEPGDALLFNLGWWRLWPDKKTIDGKPAYAGAPLIAWMIGKQLSMVGSDASLDAGPEYLLHKELILKNGIFNLEFMHFGTWPANAPAKFLFILTPLPLKGATGSPVRPIAVF